MARIDKKFILSCIEKYPEVQEYNSLFGLDVAAIKKVLSDDYSYTPADPNPMVTEDKGLFIELPDAPKPFNSIADNIKFIENIVQRMMTREYGIVNFNEVSNINISAQEDTMVVSFDRTRTETKAELAVRMVQDCEHKSLFGISAIIKTEYDDLLMAKIRAEEEKDRRRIQAEIEVLEKRKKELEGQIKK